MSEPRLEAVVAARWWTDTITGTFTHDVGGAAYSASYSYALGEPAGPAWTGEQRDAFQDALTARIEALCAGTQWMPDDPDADRSKRILMCDYGPDDRLVESARAAGLKLEVGDVPSKTWMRISPGEITASLGYGTRPVVIWSSAENAEANRG
jgi:hypothetical protein